VSNLSQSPPVASGLHVQSHYHLADIIYCDVATRVSVPLGHVAVAYNYEMENGKSTEIVHTQNG